MKCHERQPWHHDVRPWCEHRRPHAHPANVHPLPCKAARQRHDAATATCNRPTRRLFLALQRWWAAGGVEGEGVAGPPAGMPQPLDASQLVALLAAAGSSHRLLSRETLTRLQVRWEAAWLQGTRRLRGCCAAQPVSAVHTHTWLPCCNAIDGTSISAAPHPPPPPQPPHPSPPHPCSTFTCKRRSADPTSLLPLPAQPSSRCSSWPPCPSAASAASI